MNEKLSCTPMLCQYSQYSLHRALYTNIFFMALFIGCCSLAGLVMYAVYKDCDLRTAGIIKSNDQVTFNFTLTALPQQQPIGGGKNKQTNKQTNKQKQRRNKWQSKQRYFILWSAYWFMPSFSRLFPTSLFTNCHT